MKGIKMQKGITLIALIITIVVLVILAGVAISAVSDSGIIGHAKNAQTEHEIGEEKEKVTLSANEAYLAGLGTITEENLDKALESNFGAGNYSLDSSNSEYFKITITKSGREYKVYKDGKVESTLGSLGGEEGGGENPPASGDGEIGLINPNTDPFKIEAIEDLINFAMVINAGDPDGIYTGKTVTLERTLDFEDPDSYRTQNPETTKYTDINGDGTIEPIMIEMTQGNGFVPIGTMIGFDEDTEMPIMNSFKGTFEGNNNTLYNIHINRPNDFAVGLFGMVDTNITVQNLKITGNITGNGMAAAIIGMNYSEAGGEIKVSNCDISDMNFSAAGVSGIIGVVMSNTNITITDCEIAASCLLPDNIICGAGICTVGQGMENDITIKNCINSANISGQEVAGIVVNSGEGDLGDVTIENCENNGKISGIGTSSEDVNIAGIASLYDDCFVEGKIRIVGCTNNGELTTSYGPVAGILNGGSPSDGEESIIDNCINNGPILTNGDLREISGIANTGGRELVVSNCTNNGLIEAQDLECIEEISGIIVGYARELKGCTNNGAISVGNRISEVGGVYVFPFFRRQRSVY